MIYKDILKQNKLYVGWGTFSFEFPASIMNEKDVCLGLTDFGIYTIKIDGSIDNDAVKETFWHEVFHIIHESVGLSEDQITNKDEEERTKLISRGFLSILNLNPWIKDLLDEHSV